MSRLPPAISLADYIRACGALQPETDEARQGILNALGLPFQVKPKDEKTDEQDNQSREAGPTGPGKTG